MARILYGVMGDALGHVNRALIVAEQMPQHEFLFVGGGKVRGLKDRGYPVEDVPIPSTFYRNNRVDIAATVGNAVRVLLDRKRVIRRVAEVITGFDPDLIITDYEYFTPLASRSLGRISVSLDHQHVVTHCRYAIPKEERFSRLLTSQSIKKLYSRADRFLVSSFFRVPPVNPRTTEIFPPIIRRAVLEQLPTENDHVLVYQTSPTFERLFGMLEQMPGRFIIYGFGKKSSRRNLVFKGHSTRGFLQDLAACRYVITNGGHNVVSEALYLGKPIFSFPIANAYEQFLNAHFLARLGYGDYSLASRPGKPVLEEFEARLNEFRVSIKQENFFGNEEVTARLEELLANADRP
jgi:uncharacterized protein (TIGR00661 family)